MDEVRQRKRSEYHTKKFPHMIGLRLSDEHYEKIKDAPSEIIRQLLDSYEGLPKSQE